MVWWEMLLYVVICCYITMLWLNWYYSTRNTAIKYTFKRFEWNLVNISLKRTIVILIMITIIITILMFLFLFVRRGGIDWIDTYSGYSGFIGRIGIANFHEHQHKNVNVFFKNCHRSVHGTEYQRLLIVYLRVTRF